MRCFDIQPNPRDAELDETMYLGCSAILGVLVGTNQLLGGTPAGKDLWSLSAEHVALTQKRWTTYEETSAEKD